MSGPAKPGTCINRLPDHTDFYTCGSVTLPGNRYCLACRPQKLIEYARHLKKAEDIFEVAQGEYDKLLAEGTAHLPGGISEADRQQNLAKGYDCEACGGEGRDHSTRTGYCRQCCGMGKTLPPGDPRLTHDLCRGCDGRQRFRQFGRPDIICYTCGGSGIQS